MRNDSPDDAVSIGDRFLVDIARNRVNAAILDRWHELALPDPWLVAGCLFQTVWNLQSGHPPEADIQDYDLFYFDPADLSEQAERQVQGRVDELFGDLGATIEVANQARVHLWYPAYFGRPYEPLVSSRDGIRRFLVRETCVGVRPGRCDSPYGLEGLYAGTMTPNPLTPYPELFEAKVASYRRRWPHVRTEAPPSIAAMPGPATATDIPGRP